MNEDRPDQDETPVRWRWAEHREAAARDAGYVGEWPPVKPAIESAADCEHYLARLEDGEARAGLLTALGANLVAFFEHLKPEHFRCVAAVLLAVAEAGNVPGMSAACLRGGLLSRARNR